MGKNETFVALTLEEFARLTQQGTAGAYEAGLLLSKEHLRSYAVLPKWKREDKGYDPYQAQVSPLY